MKSYPHTIFYFSFYKLLTQKPGLRRLTFLLFLPGMGLSLYAQPGHPLLRLLPLDTIAYTLPEPGQLTSWACLPGTPVRLAAQDVVHDQIVSFSPEAPADLRITPIPVCVPPRAYAGTWGIAGRDSLIIQYTYGSCAANCPDPVRLVSGSGVTPFPVKAAHIALGADRFVQMEGSLRDSAYHHPFAETGQPLETVYPQVFIPLRPQAVYPGIPDSLRLSTLVLNLLTGTYAEILVPAPALIPPDGTFFQYDRLYGCQAADVRVMGYATEGRVYRWQDGQRTTHALPGAQVDTITLPTQPLGLTDNVGERHERSTGWYETLAWNPWQKQYYRVVRLPSTSGEQGETPRYSLIISDSSLQVWGEALLPYGYEPIPVPAPGGILLHHQPGFRASASGYLTLFRPEMTTIPAHKGLSPAFQQKEHLAKIPLPTAWPGC